MSNKVKILKDMLGYSGSSLIAQALALVTGFVAARLLGPTDFGIWNAVTLVLVYGAYFDLGILPAMGRDLPFYRGKGDLARAGEIESNALAATIISSIVVALIVLGISFMPGHSPLMVVGLRGMAIVIILLRLYAYYSTVLRCNNDFALLSKLQVGFALLSTFLIIIFLFQYGFTGRVIAAILSQFIILLIVLSLRKSKNVPTIEFRVSWPLIKVGVPIIISSVVIGLLTTVDRLIVIKFMGATQLGYFSIALLMTSLISLVPSMAIQVLYPRIAHRYGESGKEIGALRNFVLIPSVLLSCLLPLLIGPLYLSLPFIIGLLLPAYVQGIEAARIVLLGIFFLSIVGITDYFLVIIGKQKQNIFFGLFALFLNVSLDLLSVRMKWGIEGIAICGTMITYLCYALVLIGYALSHYTRNVRDWVKYFAKIIIPFVYMLVILYAVQWMIKYTGQASMSRNLLIVGAQLFLFTLGCLPLIYLATQEIKMDFRLMHWRDLKGLIK
ncbi:MAG: hypothetical protein C0399_09355 [Syntrophus sp. (in: bacteria)]|nr:hypothetical protein [Syntrophus sp. (in: bacteria)]